MSLIEKPPLPAVDESFVSTSGSEDSLFGDVPNDWSAEIALGPGKDGKPGTWKPQTVTLPLLRDWLTTHREGAKDGKAILQGLNSEGVRTAGAMQALYLIGVDVDDGLPSAEIDALIQKSGLFAIRYTTHSHGKSYTLVKQDAWLKWQRENPTGTAADYLTSVKGYRPEVVVGAYFDKVEEKRHTKDGLAVTLHHQPMDKNRVVFVLKEPWKADQSGKTQTEAIRQWEGAYAAFCHWLGLGANFDRSCTDPSRLFYLPRHDKDAPFETKVHEGKSIDIFALPPAPAVRKKGGGNVFTDAAGEMGAGDDATMKRLKAWAAKGNAKRFMIADALEANVPEIFRPEFDRDGKKRHIECPNEEAHGTWGGGGAYVVNPEDNDYGDEFDINCQHDSCDLGRGVTNKHLIRLQGLIDKGWINPDDLMKSEEKGGFLAEIIEEPAPTKAGPSPAPAVKAEPATVPAKPLALVVGGKAESLEDNRKRVAEAVKTVRKLAESGVPKHDAQADIAMIAKNMRGSGVTKAYLEGEYHSAVREMAALKSGLQRKAADKWLPCPDFEMKPGGIFGLVEKNKDFVPAFVCGPFRPLGYVRDTDNKGWGVLVEWTARDGTPVRETIPAVAGVGGGTEIAKIMADGGLPVATDREGKEALARLFQTLNVNRYLIETRKIGWLTDEKRGTAPAYVLPDRAYSADSDPAVHFTSEGAKSLLFNEKGSLTEWNEKVGKYCVGNDLLAFSVAAAFGGPLLRDVLGEGGGFHIVGLSQRGKSTAIVVGGSVIGGGNPRHGFCRTWSNTNVALEATALAHNDCTMFLDELGQVRAKDKDAIGRIAYDLSNGETSGRGTVTGGLRKGSSFLTLFLSTGEETIGQKVEQYGGKQKAGTKVRMADIWVDGQTIGNTHKMGANGKESAEAVLSKTVKANALRTYGAPFRAWLVALTADGDAYERMCERVRADMDAFIQEHGPDKADPQILTVVRRFAFVAAVGKAAVEERILTWEEGEPARAVAAVMKLWLSREQNVSQSEETAQGVQRVRSFLERHGHSRFMEPIDPKQAASQSSGAVASDADDEEKLVADTYARIGNLAGVRRPASDGTWTYYIFPSVWDEEVCHGMDAKRVARELHAEKHLENDGGNRLQKELRVRELGKRRFYAVKSSIFDDVTEPSGGKPPAETADAG